MLPLKLIAGIGFIAIGLWTLGVHFMVVGACFAVVAR
jgi:hypothetical protein